MRESVLWLVALAIAPLGCFAPAVRPVAMADFGQVSATVGGIFPDEDNSSSWLEGSAVLAAGIAPHLQLEAAGAIDQGNPQTSVNANAAVNTGSNWSIGGGLRGAIPLGEATDIQLAALYDRLDSTHMTNFCGTSVESWEISRETVELGLTGRIGDRTLEFGVWLDGMVDEIPHDVLVDPGGTPLSMSGMVLQLGARVGIELRPWPDSLRWLSFVLNVSGAGHLATLSGNPDGPYPWLNVGLGTHLLL